MFAKSFSRISTIGLSSSVLQTELVFQKDILCRPSAFSFIKNTQYHAPQTQDVNWTYIRRPGRLLNVLCTFNVRPVSTGRRFAGNFPKSAMQQFLRITQDNWFCISTENFGGMKFKNLTFTEVTFGKCS